MLLLVLDLDPVSLDLLLQERYSFEGSSPEFGSCWVDYSHYGSTDHYYEILSDVAQSQPQCIFGINETRRSSDPFDPNYFNITSPNGLRRLLRDDPCLPWKQETCTRLFPFNESYVFHARAGDQEGYQRTLTLFTLTWGPRGEESSPHPYLLRSRAFLFAGTCETTVIPPEDPVFTTEGDSSNLGEVLEDLGLSKDSFEFKGKVEGSLSPSLEVLPSKVLYEGSPSVVCSPVNLSFQVEEDLSLREAFLAVAGPSPYSLVDGSPYPQALYPPWASPYRYWWSDFGSESTSPLSDRALLPDEGCILDGCWKNRHLLNVEPPSFWGEEWFEEGPGQGFSFVRGEEWEELQNAYSSPSQLGYWLEQDAWEEVAREVTYHQDWAQRDLSFNLPPIDDSADFVNPGPKMIEERAPRVSWLEADGFVEDAPSSLAYLYLGHSYHRLSLEYERGLDGQSEHYGYHFAGGVMVPTVMKATTRWRLVCQPPTPEFQGAPQGIQLLEQQVSSTSVNLTFDLPSGDYSGTSLSFPTQCFLVVSPGPEPTHSPTDDSFPLLLSQGDLEDLLDWTASKTYVLGTQQGAAEVSLAQVEGLPIRVVDYRSDDDSLFDQVSVAFSGGTWSITNQLLVPAVVIFSDSVHSHQERVLPGSTVEVSLDFYPLQYTVSFEACDGIASRTYQTQGPDLNLSWFSPPFCSGQAFFTVINVSNRGEVPTDYLLSWNLSSPEGDLLAQGEIKGGPLSPGTWTLERISVEGLSTPHSSMVFQANLSPVGMPDANPSDNSLSWQGECSSFGFPCTCSFSPSQVALPPGGQTTLGLVVFPPNCQGTLTVSPQGLLTASLRGNFVEVEAGGEEGTAVLTYSFPSGTSCSATVRVEALPDLQPLLQVQPIFVGYPFQISYGVEETTGYPPENSFWVRLQNGSPTTPPVLTDEFEVSGLPGGGEAWQSLERVLTSPSSIVYSVEVDPEDSVYELEEGNNEVFQTPQVNVTSCEISGPSQLFLFLPLQLEVECFTSDITSPLEDPLACNGPPFTSWRVEVPSFLNVQLTPGSTMALEISWDGGHGTSPVKVNVTDGITVCSKEIYLCTSCVIDLG